MNWSDRESELINFIRANAPIRTDILLKNYNKAVKREHKLGESTLYKKLDQFEEDQVITRVKGKDELKRYGINDPDGRAKYVFVKATVESKETFDAIISKLSSKNEIDQKLSIEWIARYRKRYPIFQNQLDILNKNLKNLSLDLQKEIVPIIYETILDKKIDPTNKEMLLEGLRDILTHCPTKSEGYKDLRRKVIHLLANYNDETVINQVISDAKNDCLEHFADIYEEAYTAEIIQKNELKLFNLQSDLIKRGKNESARKISEILDKVQPYYGIPATLLSKKELMRKKGEVQYQKGLYP